MDLNIKDIFSKIFKNNIRLSDSENVLIITDNHGLAEDVSFCCYEMGSTSTVVYIPNSIRPIKKLNKTLDKIIGEFSIILLLVSRRFDETNFRTRIMEKYENGPRILYMAGLGKKEILENQAAILTDPQSMKQIGDLLSFVLSISKKIKIETNDEYLLEMNISGWDQKAGAQYGLVNERRMFDNLPTGKVFIHPISDKVNGKIAINLSIPDNLLKNNILLEFKNGILENISGDEVANKLNETILKIEKIEKDEDKRKNVRRICEFGVGLNENAMICGLQIVDDKVAGTAHIAIGHSKIVGGKFEAPIHYDFVFNNAKIMVDGITIIDHGKIIIDNLEKLAALCYRSLDSKINKNQLIKRNNTPLMCDISEHGLYINWEDATHRWRKNLIGDVDTAKLAANIYNKLINGEYKRIEDISSSLGENIQDITNTVEIMMKYGIIKAK